MNKSSSTDIFLINRVYLSIYVSRYETRRIDKKRTENINQLATLCLSFYTVMFCHMFKDPKVNTHLSLFLDVTILFDAIDTHQFAVQKHTHLKYVFNIDIFIYKPSCVLILQLA